MRLSIKLGICLLLLLLIPSSLYAGGGFLQYKFNKGQEFQVDSEHYTATSSSGNDQSFNLEAHVKFVIDESQNHKFKARSILLKSSNSSKSDLTSRGLPTFNNPKTLNFDRHGKNLDKEEFIQTYLMVALPDKKVKIGDSWKQTTTLDEESFTKKMDINYTYTLEKISKRRDMALALITYKIAGRDSGRSRELQGKGKFVLNLSQGIPVQHQYSFIFAAKTQVNLETKISGNSHWKLLPPKNEYEDLLGF
jgi:hypothetical protein